PPNGEDGPANGEDGPPNGEDGPPNGEDGFTTVASTSVTVESSLSLDIEAVGWLATGAVIGGGVPCARIGAVSRSRPRSVTAASPNRPVGEESKLNASSSAPLTDTGYPPGRKAHEKTPSAGLAGQEPRPAG